MQRVVGHAIGVRYPGRTQPSRPELETDVPTTPPLFPAQSPRSRDMTVDSAGVQAAMERIQLSVRRTPVLVAADAPLAAPVALKLECLQHTGSFKARGAFNRILSAQESGLLTEAGVIIASGGNAGMAVAHAAGTLGVRAEVYLPRSSSPVKRARLEAYGAHVTVTGDHYADAYEECLSQADRTRALLVHAYDQPEVVTGQGTVAVELMEQADGAVDTVLVAVGGGGLAAGVAVALGDAASVVVVEPRSIPTYHAARTAGHPVDVDVSGIAADSLGARRIGSIAWDVLDGVGAEAVLVEDEAILAARTWLWERCRLAVEAGGAAALGALLSGSYRPQEGERVAVIICGANTDPGDLASNARGNSNG